MRPRYPLQARDRGARRDDGFGIEELVLRRWERLACAPDVEHGDFGGRGPAEDIARGSYDGARDARLVEHGEGGSAEFFEAGQGVSAGAAVAEDPYEGIAVELEVGHVGRFAKKVIPGFVDAFAGGWFEYPDFRFCDLKSSSVSRLYRRYEK